MKSVKRLVLIGLIGGLLMAAVGAAAAQGRGREREPRRFGGEGRDGFNLVAVIAENLDLSVREIRQQVREGATLAEVIEANGGDVEAITAEAVEAVTNRINEAVERGRLTQESADQLLENVETTITDALNGEFERRRFSDRGFSREERAIFDLLAEATGLSMRELREALRGGATLAELLQENSVDPETFIDEVLAEAETRLQTAVEAGRISQERAEQLLERLRERLPALLERQFNEAAERDPLR